MKRRITSDEERKLFEQLAELRHEKLKVTAAEKLIRKTAIVIKITVRKKTRIKKLGLFQQWVRCMMDICL